MLHPMTNDYISVLHNVVHAWCFEINIRVLFNKLTVLTQVPQFRCSSTVKNVIFSVGHTDMLQSYRLWGYLQ